MRTIGLRQRIIEGMFVLAHFTITAVTISTAFRPLFSHCAAVTSSF